MEKMRGVIVSDKPNPDFGKQIGETVRTALESGDLSRLKEIGPTVQSAVKETLANTAEAMGEEKKKQARHTYPPPTQKDPMPPPQGYGKTAPRPPQPRQQQQAKPPSAPGWYSRSGAVRPSMARTGYGVGSIVLGIMGIIAFGLTGLFLGIAALASAAASLAYWAAAMLVPFVLSTGLLGGGIGRRGLTNRLKRYVQLFGDKNVVTIEEISEVTGRSGAAIRRDVRKGIDKRLLRDIRLDVQETCIIRGEEAYRLYIETEEARRQREAEQAERQRRMEDPKTAPIETFREEGKAVIKMIREANEAIPGEEISQKLDTLEQTTSRIFSYVEKHPEKLPDTRKFMNYYLPTTLKLVEKYRQYEEIDVQMDNVLRAKKDIEETLDTIDLAFNNLLESLYHEDTLDVATDIEVLQTMLEQEGLTGRKFDIEGSEY